MVKNRKKKLSKSLKKNPKNLNSTRTENKESYERELKYFSNKDKRYFFMFYFLLIQ